MPRTKMPKSRSTRTKQKPNSGQMDAMIALNEFKKKVEKEKDAINSVFEKEMRSLDMSFDLILMTIAPALLNKTMGDLMAMECKENTPLTGSNGPPSKGLLSSFSSLTTTDKKTSESSRDDGYVTEGSVVSVSARPARMSRRRSRSAAPVETNGSGLGGTTIPRATTRKRSSSVNQQTTKKARKTHNQYQTPAYKGPNQFPSITPKIVPNTPLAILRKARQGEMVISMSGSPILVPSSQMDETANLNIPLFDGTTLCMLPQRMRQPKAQIPISLLPPEVVRQLQTLQENLNNVVQSCGIQK